MYANPRFHRILPFHTIKSAQTSDLGYVNGGGGEGGLAGEYIMALHVDIWWCSAGKVEVDADWGTTTGG